MPLLQPGAQVNACCPPLGLFTGPWHMQLPLGHTPPMGSATPLSPLQPAPSKAVLIREKNRLGTTEYLGCPRTLSRTLRKFSTSRFSVRQCLTLSVPSKGTSHHASQQ